MFRIVIVILIYHRHKPRNLILYFTASRLKLVKKTHNYMAFTRDRFSLIFALKAKRRVKLPSVVITRKKQTKTDRRLTGNVLSYFSRFQNIKFTNNLKLRPSLKSEREKEII
jgi:hypothetical protein